jgi:hypothetical protein
LVVQRRRARLCVRVQRPIDDLSKLSAKRKIRARRFSRVKVKQALSESGTKTKYDISIAIAKRFPNSRLVYHVSENPG